MCDRITRTLSTILCLDVTLCGPGWLTSLTSRSCIKFVWKTETVYGKKKVPNSWWQFVEPLRQDDRENDLWYSYINYYTCEMYILRFPLCDEKKKIFFLFILKCRIISSFIYLIIYRRTNVTFDDNVQ